MAQLINKPSIIKAAGTKEKIIEEYVGNVNTLSPGVSIARMVSPEGWVEPGQKPLFDEYTVVLKGAVHVETAEGKYIVRAGQGIITTKGEWIRYSSPEKGGAEYIAVCIPAFSPDSVNRDM
jgi:mannose-6-phosphate isomerase-like protein (cupin superfamily)